MPILGFETHRQRKYLSRAIIHASENKNHKGDTETERLIKAYMREGSSLHCRRTLDQFLYYMLPSTEARDINQVLYRSAKRDQPDKKVTDRPVLMVDQLWLWLSSDGSDRFQPHLLLLMSIGQIQLTAYRESDNVFP